VSFCARISFKRTTDFNELTTQEREAVTCAGTPAVAG